MLLGETPEDYDKHFILTADIDLDPNLTGRKVFDRAVIAPDVNDNEQDFQGTPFTGVFNGNGYAISHFTIIGVDYSGLFGHLGSGGIISSLGIEDVNVNGFGDYVGGLAGSNGHWSWLELGSRITDCHCIGTVDGGSYVGGLVGRNNSSITTSYSVSEVSSGSNQQGSFAIGGLVGYNRYGGSISMSFWDIETSGQTTSTGGEGKSTVEMQMAGTLLEAGWDFVDETANGTEDIWWIDEGKDYPRLWWER